MNNSLNISLPFTDPVLIFALVMLLILLAPMAFRKLRIPGVVGLILSGTLVGPGLLGLLERDDTIQLLGTVGLLYLMFMAGLSIDLNRFEKLRNRSMGFGLMSYVLPAAGAYFAGIHLLDYSLATSLLLGAIVGSHTLLAYPIIERLGITKNTAVTMTMGGTLVTDSLSLGVLAIIAGSIAENQGAGYWAGFITSIVVFVAAAIIILPRLGSWFFRNVKYENNVDFVFMVAVLFSTAFLAELAGLASIIGGFLAGLLLNRLVPQSGTLMSRIQFVGNALFIPFFLISVGMLVDIQVLTKADVWIKAIIFTLLVFFGKGLASLFIKWIFKYSKAEGFVIYGLTTPQSAATLAVTLLGFELGFFDQVAVNAVVVMILFTVLFGPWLVENYGRKVVIEEEVRPYEPSEAPQRLLVPLANPESADALMDIAFMVRDDKSDQAVLPLTVAREGGDMDAQVARSEKMLSHAVVHAAAADVPVNPITRIDLNVAKGIARAVNENLVTNVIIGWNGQISAKQRIFGTILDQLLMEIDEMVMVCKIDKPVNTFERVVIAIPPFASLEFGFATAVRSLKLLAEQIGGDLILISTNERIEIAQRRINIIKPKIDIEYNGIKTWSDLTDWLDDKREESDLFILFSAREGSLSWRPALDRLPRVISQRYPDLSFITVYPSEVEKQSSLMNGNLALNILEKSRIKVGLQCKDLNEILIEILSVDESLQQLDKDRFVRRLLNNSSDYSPEMMAGVVLFDAHTSLINKQKLFIGVNEEGIQIPNTAHPVHVVLLVLSPKEIKVEEHLKGVNTIAKLIRPGRLLDKIKNATKAEEVYDLLMKPKTVKVS
ncbi:MAG: cation:proton antiporter [Balneolaceae bacterium]